MQNLQLKREISKFAQTRKVNQRSMTSDKLSRRKTDPQNCFSVRAGNFIVSPTNINRHRFSRFRQRKFVPMIIDKFVNLHFIRRNKNFTPPMANSDSPNSPSHDCAKPMPKMCCLVQTRLKLNLKVRKSLRNISKIYFS